MTENIQYPQFSAEGLPITYVPNPSSADGASSSGQWKDPVRVATTGNITLYGLQTIDTVGVMEGDRVLVKDQNSPAENGIYIASSGAWRRSSDMSQWPQFVAAVVVIKEYPSNPDKLVWLTEVSVTGTVDVTPVYWITSTSSSGTLPTFTALRALVSNVTGEPTASSTTAQEIAYVSGVTSAIQPQIDSVRSAASSAFTIAVGGTNLSAAVLSVANSAYALAQTGTAIATPAYSIAVAGTNAAAAAQSLANSAYIIAQTGTTVGSNAYNYAVALGDKYVRTTRFASIGAGTSGTVTLPANSTVVLDDFGGSTDAVITALSGGRPSFNHVFTAAGAVVSTTFDSSGNYSLSGAPNAYPVALVYRVRQKLSQFDSTATDIIGSYDTEQIDYVQGTPNQVYVNGSVTPQYGPIALSLPQDIATTSSPTFDVLTATGTVRSIVGQFDHIDPVNYIDFDTVNSGTLSQLKGRMHWDTLDQTMAIDMADPDVTLQVGQESHIYVRNDTATSIHNGQAVYVSGANGQRPTVALASAVTRIPSRGCVGLATAGIGINANGYVTTQGIVRGLDTNSFTEGRALFLSTVEGELTMTPPTQPNSTVFIGICVKKSAGSGAIFVDVRPVDALSELQDVYIPVRNVGDRLVFNGTLWVAESGTAAPGYLLASAAYALAQIGTNTGTAAYNRSLDAYSLAQIGTNTGTAAYNAALAASNVASSALSIAQIGTNTGTAAYSLATSGSNFAWAAYNIAQAGTNNTGASGVGGVKFDGATVGQGAYAYLPGLNFANGNFTLLVQHRVLPTQTARNTVVGVGLLSSPGGKNEVSFTVGSAGDFNVDKRNSAATFANAYSVSGYASLFSGKTIYTSIVRNAGTFQAYVNGYTYGQAYSGMSTEPCDGNYVHISHSSTPYNERINQVAVFNYPLTQTQLQSIVFDGIPEADRWAGLYGFNLITNAGSNCTFALPVLSTQTDWIAAGATGSIAVDTVNKALNIVMNGTADGAALPSTAIAQLISGGTHTLSGTITTYSGGGSLAMVTPYFNGTALGQSYSASGPFWTEFVPAAGVGALVFSGTASNGTVAVTDLQLKRNLLGYSDFEIAGVGGASNVANNVFMGWTASWTTGTVTRDTVNQRTGSACCKIVTGGDNANTFLAMHNMPSIQFSPVVGRRYKLSFWAKGGGTGASEKVTYRLGGASAPDLVEVALTTSWQYIESAPVVYLGTMTIGRGSTGSAGQTVFIDNVELVECGAVASFSAWGLDKDTTLFKNQANTGDATVVGLPLILSGANRGYLEENALATQSRALRDQGGVYLQGNSNQRLTVSNFPDIGLNSFWLRFRFMCPSVLASRGILYAGPSSSVASSTAAMSVSLDSVGFLTISLFGSGSTFNRTLKVQNVVNMYGGRYVDCVINRTTTGTLQVWLNGNPVTGVETQGNGTPWTTYLNSSFLCLGVGYAVTPWLGEFYGFQVGRGNLTDATVKQLINYGAGTGSGTSAGTPISRSGSFVTGVDGLVSDLNLGVGNGYAYPDKTGNGYNAVSNLADELHINPSPFREAVVTQTATAIQLTDVHYAVLADTTSNNVQVFLPTAVGNSGRRYRVKRKSGGSNNLSIIAVSGQTIDGNGTFSIAPQYASADFTADGANWFVI